MRRLAAIFVTGAVAAFGAIALEAKAQQSTLSQEAVKAAFISRFASFVQWPAAAFADAHAPIRICLLGDGAFGRLLEGSVYGQLIDERGFEVRRLSDSTGARDCHVVYVTGEAVAETLRVLRGRPVLTVTDAATGATRGMIHFSIVRDHVRFHIDDAQAAEGGLFISSRLLALAVSVRRRG
jgi:hypothetical protein